MPDPKKHGHSDQETMFQGFLMALGSWWNISENVDRGFTQNFDARLVSIVVCPVEPFSETCFFWPWFQVPMLIFPGTSSQNVFFRSALHLGMYTYSQVLRMGYFQYFQDSGSLEWFVFQYFQDPGCLEWIVFQYFLDSGSLEWAVFSISRIQGPQDGPFSNICKFKCSRQPNQNNTRSWM